MNTLYNRSVIFIASELHSLFELKLKISLTQPKVMCLIVICSAGISDEGKKELEQTIVSLKNGKRGNQPCDVDGRPERQALKQAYDFVKSP